MREILFRAKRIDNGEWVCGSLSMEYFRECGCVMISPSADTCYKVAVSTVGQFTGLTDKNGKKVFEGDILKFTDVNADYEWIGRVEFGNPNEEYNWGFQLVYIKGEKPNTDILCWFDMEETGAFAEIIGNIHDNPELLEVADNA